MLSGPLPTMHVAKQRHRETEGPDSMILQRIEKMGIAKEMAGSALAGKPKRYPRYRSADLFCKGHSAQGHHGSVAPVAGPSQRRRDRPQRYRSFSPPQGQSMQKTRLWACRLNQLTKSCHVSLKGLMGSMRMRLFEVVGSALKSPRHSLLSGRRAYPRRVACGQQGKVGCTDARWHTDHGYTVHSRDISSLKVCAECKASRRSEYATLQGGPPNRS